MKTYAVGIALIALTSSASALEYCKGTVKTLVTRDNYQATYVTLNTTAGESGEAKVGGFAKYSDNEKIQVQMLIDAFMNGKKVNLELDTTGRYFNSCTDFASGMPVRFVGLGFN